MAIADAWCIESIKFRRRQIDTYGRHKSDITLRLITPLYYWQSLDKVMARARECCTDSTIVRT